MRSARMYTVQHVAHDASCRKRDIVVTWPQPEHTSQVSIHRISAATSEFLAHGPTDLKLFPCNKFHPSSTVPKPIGPFSQALKIGLRFAYVSPTFRLQTRVFPISYVVQ